MTLSNIFFGKKVVQQAYLNNALIYQSKGWETLPSTCGEVWTKTYGSAEHPKAIDIDSQNNIYVGADNFLYKINTDGKVIWKVKVTVPKDDVYMWNYVVIKSILASTDFIICSIYGYDVLNDQYGFYVFQLDKDGTTLKYIPLPDEWVFDMTKDSSNIYLASQHKLLKLDFNLNVVASAYDSHVCRSVTTANNSKYVFVGIEQSNDNTCAIRYDKSTLGNAYKITDSAYSLDTIKLDSTNNLYLASSSVNVGIKKFNAETCSRITTIYEQRQGTGRCQQICTDFQDNVYFVFYVAVNYDRNIVCNKYSSDGTFMWSTPTIAIPDASNYTRQYDTATQAITDSNGNIYITYYNTDGYLTIRKYINLVKEN